MPEHRELADAIRERLDRVQDPCSVAAGTPMGLTEMGMVASVDISPDGDVTIGIRLTSPFCHMVPFLYAESKREVGELDGVRSVEVSADQGLDWSPSLISEDAAARRRLRLEVVRGTAR